MLRNHYILPDGGNPGFCLLQHLGLRVGGVEEAAGGTAGEIKNSCSWESAEVSEANGLAHLRAGI